MDVWEQALLAQSLTPLQAANTAVQLPILRRWRHMVWKLCWLTRELDHWFTLGRAIKHFSEEWGFGKRIQEVARRSWIVRHFA